MEKYLSIGDVVKMKGVSHRSLRHYDEIGILVPAYVNEETGYRYYSKNQMLILDIITLCVSFGIPLKQFKTYVSPQAPLQESANISIDIQKLINDAQEKALEAQRKMHQNIYFLNSVAEHLAQFKENTKQGRVYSKSIAERFFLTLPAPLSSVTSDSGNWQEYLTNMTKLYDIALKNHFFLSVNQGFCISTHNNTKAHYFVEIKEAEICDVPHIIIPQGNFTCEIFEETDLNAALNKYTAHEHYLAGNILIFNDVLEHTITHKPVPFEVQLMLPSAL